MLFYRVVEHLLRNDANPSMRDHSGFGAVHYAALNGHNLALEMVRDWIISADDSLFCFFYGM